MLHHSARSTTNTCLLAHIIKHRTISSQSRHNLFITPVAPCKSDTVLKPEHGTQLNSYKQPRYERALNCSIERLLISASQSKLNQLLLSPSTGPNHKMTPDLWYIVTFYCWIRDFPKRSNLKQSRRFNRRFISKQTAINRFNVQISRTILSIFNLLREKRKNELKSSVQQKLLDNRGNRR